MKRLCKLFLLLGACVSLLFLTGCKTTKYAKVGLDLKYSGGEFKLRPEASIGVTGHQ